LIFIILKTNFVARHNITSSQELIRQLNVVNEQLSRKYREGNTDDSNTGSGVDSGVSKGKTKNNSSKAVLPNAIKKAKENNFFLGLSKNWISEN
jgi:hypothetical protein